MDDDVMRKNGSWSNTMAVSKELSPTPTWRVKTRSWICMLRRWKSGANSVAIVNADAIVNMPSKKNNKPEFIGLHSTNPIKKHRMPPGPHLHRIRRGRNQSCGWVSCHWRFAKWIAPSKKSHALTDKMYRPVYAVMLVLAGRWSMLTLVGGSPPTSAGVHWKV